MADLREELETELAQHLYRWAPIKKSEMPQDVITEIAKSFCTREGRKLISVEISGPEWAFVSIDGRHSIELHSAWRSAFQTHGYSEPLLICEDDLEPSVDTMDCE